MMLSNVQLFVLSIWPIPQDRQKEQRQVLFSWHQKQAEFEMRPFKTIHLLYRLHKVHNEPLPFIVIL